MKKIYLFRHGETDWNLQNKIQCSSDIELNSNGLIQAEILSNKLLNKNIQHIYSSKLKRAYKTAEIIANKLNIKVEIFDGLEEVFAGTAEGKTRLEIENLMGKENFEKMIKSNEGHIDFSFFGGETRQNIKERFLKTFSNILETKQYDIVAISTHGFFVKEIFKQIHLEDSILIKNCDVLEMDLENNKLKCIKLLK